MVASCGNYLSRFDQLSAAASISVPATLLLLAAVMTEAEWRRVFPGSGSWRWEHP